jgi:cysteine desulfuration protein SufE
MVGTGCINGSLAASLKPCRASIDNQGFVVFLAEKLQRVIDDHAVLPDAQERLAALVDRARRIPPLPPAERTDVNRVRGCVSIVWLLGETRGEHCFFRSDAESPLVRGLVAFLCDFFNGATARDIAEFEPDPLEALGVMRDLSPTRRNGLAAARRAIRDFARRAVTPS